MSEFEPHEVENIYPQCEFVFTDEPGVYRCRRCDFKTRKLDWPPEKVHKQCTVPDTPERKLPCAHRGERLGDETCETREGNWRSRTFACPVHGVELDPASALRTHLDLLLGGLQRQPDASAEKGR